MPDSPVMSTGADVGDARSRVAYTARIGAAEPTRRPKRSATLSGTSMRPLPGTTFKRVRPSSTSSSPRVETSRTVSPPTRVPLRLPRSRTCTPSSVASNSAW